MFPVVAGRDAGDGETIVRAHRSRLRGGTAIFCFRFDGWHAVSGRRAGVVCRSAARTAPAVLGFMVNLNWAREHYFADLVAQVARIEGSDRAIEFSVVDDANRPVVGPGGRGSVDSASASFPMAFFDPTDRGRRSSGRPARRTVDGRGESRTRSDARGGGERRPADAGGRRRDGAALTIGLWLSLEAGRASETLADMRADFVSAVTHELKTPIANMRAIHETLASGV